MFKSVKWLCVIYVIPTKYAESFPHRNHIRNYNWRACNFNRNINKMKLPGTKQLIRGYWNADRNVANRETLFFADAVGASTLRAVGFDEIRIWKGVFWLLFIELGAALVSNNGCPVINILVKLFHFYFSYPVGDCWNFQNVPFSAAGRKLVTTRGPVVLGLLIGLWHLGPPWDVAVVKYAALLPEEAVKLSRINCYVCPVPLYDRQLVPFFIEKFRFCRAWGVDSSYYPLLITVPFSNVAAESLRMVHVNNVIGAMMIWK